MHECECKTKILCLRCSKSITKLNNINTFSCPGNFIDNLIDMYMDALCEPSINLFPLGHIVHYWMKKGQLLLVGLYILNACHDLVLSLHCREA